MEQPVRATEIRSADARKRLERQAALVAAEGLYARAGAARSGSDHSKWLVAHVSAALTAAG